MREIGERWIEKHRREIKRERERGGGERGRERQTDRDRDRQTTDRQSRQRIWHERAQKAWQTKNNDTKHKGKNTRGVEKESTWLINARCRKKWRKRNPIKWKRLLSRLKLL